MTAVATRPVTVAVVAPRFLEVGGMQHYARRVVQWLQADPAFEVVVVSSKPGPGRDEQWVDGVRVIRLGTWLTLSNTPVNPLWAAQLRRLFDQLGIDVVNAHSPVPYLADMAVLAAGPRPVVLTYHSGSLMKGTGGIVDAALRTYEHVVQPRVFARCERLVAVSPVASTMATGRATLIPPGVDTDVFVPPSAATPRAPRIAFVGRIERTSRWKGLHVLLDALPAVLDRVPAARLDIVGDGDLRAELQQRAEGLGVGRAVSWHGALPPGAVVEVLQQASVAVLPSLTESESFGMSLVEAMACATPVIGSDVGGIPFVVRDGVDGLLVPPGDAGALAAAIGTVLTDADLAARLGAHGRAAAEQTWDWTHQEERTMAELRSAAHAVSLVCR